VKTVFFRLLEADDKAEALLAAIREPKVALGKQRFELETSSFAAVPRSPFAYWVGDRLREIFTDFPALEANGRVARQGGVNGDDFRWLRLWTETSPKGNRGRFVPIAKGGKFSPYYADLALQCWWDPTRDTFWAFTGLPHRPSLKPASFDFYFRAGLTWPRRTNGLSLRTMPSGCIFADKGPAAFVEKDDSEGLLALAAVTNSQPFTLLVSLQLARTELAQSYEVGLLQRTPIPDLNQGDQSRLAVLARRAWYLKRSLDTRIETSNAFVLPTLLQVEGDTLSMRAKAWAEHVAETFAELAAIQGEIDACCFGLYGIDDADSRAIVEGFGDGAGDSDQPVATDADADDEGDTETSADAASLAAELISWAIGVAFGRFDLRLSTGARLLLVEPAPFDPLPACSPAMLANDEGLPLLSAPDGYQVAVAENGILVDDLGDAQDITLAIRGVFEKIFKADADSWWDEVGEVLAPKDRDLRPWLKSIFFEHHLKHYSKSRRKSPIYWQLAVPSGRYSVWIYAHRLTRDSFFQIQNEVVTPKLAHEERLLTGLIQSAGGNPSATERKAIAEQESFVGELRSFLDEVKHVAPLWNPVLDDGVVLTMAPLWRLIPQHKPWQRELKSKWDELAAGKYDWANVAMHLWPERVIPKCATDRSLAIAHALEDVFWTEADDGKWQASPTPTISVDRLLGEQTSVAVKAALKGMTEASVPNGPKPRARRSSS
jgi:hypothetical protein